MSLVVVSYRRADSAKWANELYNSLWVRYGKDLIFQDVDDIKPGEDFLETIRAHLESSQVFLILIGPHWLIDAQGRRRLDDPQDVFRMKVTEGLSSEGTVIPVLVGKAHMPSPQELPEPLKPLSRRQAVKLRDEECEEALVNGERVFRTICKENSKFDAFFTKPDRRIFDER